MKRTGFLSVLAACTFAPRAARAADTNTTAPLSLAGIALGSPVAALVGTLGFPAAVASTDLGHRWDWSGNGTTLIAMTDDDAKVLAVDFTPAGTAPPLTFTVDGKPRTLAFGTYTLAKAQAELSTVSDIATLNGAKLFRLTPTRELALFFDAKGVLSRAVLGDRLTLARLGFMPADDVGGAFAFKAPRANGTVHPALHGADPPAHPAIVRVDVDRDGTVASATVLVSSGNPVFDDAAVKALLGQSYRAATIGGKSIASTVFREIAPS